MPSTTRVQIVEVKGADGAIVSTTTTTETITTGEPESNVTQVTAADLMEPGTAPATE